MTNILDRVETISELARIYGVTPRALYQAIEKGQLIARKSGGTWLSTRRNTLMHLRISKRRRMLPELRALALRIMRDCESEDALTDADLDYLNSIRGECDLMNFTDSGDESAHSLAMSAAAALGMPQEWIDARDAEYYSSRER